MPDAAYASMRLDVERGRHSCGSVDLGRVHGGGGIHHHLNWRQVLSGHLSKGGELGDGFVDTASSSLVLDFVCRKYVGTHGFITPTIPAWQCMACEQ